MTISPGEMVGPYRVIEQLGSGGMATVFKAYHAALDRYVAIKILHPAFKADPQFFERFKREARIVANLEHPNIIPVYDFNEHNGEPYLVMRYIEGDTLKPKMVNGPMASQEILRLMRPICYALGYAHKQGVLHRDIKPSNIMLTHDGNVFLSDFGLARMVQVGESTLSQDMMVGTPQYISPEQAQGVSQLDGRTDIYSLGVVLFEMLTGQVPFSADTPFATIHDHIYTPLPVPSSINPNIDPAAERLLLKALAKEPDDRFATAEDLLEAIEHTIATPTGSTVTTTPTKSKSGTPWWVWAGGATMVVCMCVLLAGLLMARNRNQQTQPNSGPISPPVVDQGEPSSSLPTDDQVDEPNVDEPSDGTTDDAREQAIELTQQGREAMRAGNTEEAIHSFEQATATDPHFLPAYFNLSDLYRQNDLPQESIGVLEAAVEHNPEEAVAWARLGESMLFTTEEPEAALNAFQEASALEPDASAPYAGQALSLLLLDEEEAAKEAIEQALLLDPNSYEARLANAVYLGKQGQRLPALRELRQLVSDRNSPILVKERARQLIEMLQQ